MTDLATFILQPGQVVLNKYEVIRPLGAGNFGQVFQVFNRNLQQHSALKVVFVEDPVAHQAVVEAQVMSLCGHDHVVKILTADVFEDHALIEMEYIEGGSLGGPSQPRVRARRRFHQLREADTFCAGVRA